MTFTALTTVAKKAGSGTAGREKEEPARGVDTGGTTGTTEAMVAFIDEATTSKATGATKESPKASKQASKRIKCPCWAKRSPCAMLKGTTAGQHCIEFKLA